MPYISSDTLMREKLLEKVYGSLPPSPRLAFPIWARSQPKPIFTTFVKLAEAISKAPLVVLVDDVWTQIFTERTDEEQLAINRLYSEFFVGSGCKVKFSSSFLPPFLEILREVGTGLSLEKIKHVLPREKRNDFSRQSYKELTHVVIELSVLKQASEYADAIVMGSFSQGMASLYRSVITNPLPVIITPTLKGEAHAREYCKQLEGLTLT